MLHSEPSAIALGDGRIDLLVRSGDLPPGASTSTVSSSNRWSGWSGPAPPPPPPPPPPLNVGRSFIVVVVEVRGDDGRLVAQVTQTQAVLGG